MDNHNKYVIFSSGNFKVRNLKIQMLTKCTAKYDFNFIYRKHMLIVQNEYTIKNILVLAQFIEKQNLLQLLKQIL